MRDGDLAVDGDRSLLAERRRKVVDLPWTWLRQMHGADVVTVSRPGEHAGAPADAAVTAQRGAVLAVHTADCVPVLLASPHAVGAIHAGWRGLAAGVVEATVKALCEFGAAPTAVVAHVGPCIRARCYEFSAADLDAVAAGLGDHIRATTAWGTPALDLVGGVQAALAAAGVSEVRDAATCTACSPVHFSHRARGDCGRQAGLVWLPR